VTSGRHRGDNLHLSMDGVTISLDLTQEQADALAQLCKRADWARIRSLAATEHEAHVMTTGLFLLGRELVYHGFAPR
jgi:hypothetical protein